MLLSSKFLLKYHLYWEAPAFVRLDCRNTHPNTLALTLRFPLFYSLIVSYTSRLNSLGRLRTQCLLLGGSHSGPLGVTVLQILNKGNRLLPRVCWDTIAPLQSMAAFADASGQNFKVALTKLEMHLQQTIKHDFPTCSLKKTIGRKSGGVRRRFLFRWNLKEKFKEEFAFSSPSKNRTGNCKWHQWFGLYD